MIFLYYSQQTCMIMSVLLYWKHDGKKKKTYPWWLALFFYLSNTAGIWISFWIGSVSVAAARCTFWAVGVLVLGLLHVQAAVCAVALSRFSSCPSSRRRTFGSTRVSSAAPAGEAEPGFAGPPYKHPRAEGWLTLQTLQPRFSPCACSGMSFAFPTCRVVPRRSRAGAAGAGWALASAAVTWGLWGYFEPDEGEPKITTVLWP